MVPIANSWKDLFTSSSHGTSRLEGPMEEAARTVTPMLEGPMIKTTLGLLLLLLLLSCNVIKHRCMMCEKSQL